MASRAPTSGGSCHRTRFLARPRLGRPASVSLPGRRESGRAVVRLTPAIAVLVAVIAMEALLIAMTWGEWGIHWWKRR
jgi:hypothetical protein